MKKIIKIKKKELSKIESEYNELKEQVNNFQEKCSKKKKELSKLRQEIENVLHPPKPSISEHVIVRYFERVKGENIEEIKKEILNEEVMKLFGLFGGNGKYPSNNNNEDNNNYEIVMKNNVVVTVV